MEDGADVAVADHARDISIELVWVDVFLQAGPWRARCISRLRGERERLELKEKCGRDDRSQVGAGLV